MVLFGTQLEVKVCAALRWKRSNRCHQIIHHQWMQWMLCSLSRKCTETLNRRSTRFSVNIVNRIALIIYSVQTILRRRVLSQMLFVFTSTRSMDQRGGPYSTNQGQDQAKAGSYGLNSNIGEYVCEKRDAFVVARIECSSAR